MNLSALRHRNFRLLWLGQTVSQLGDAFYYLVFLFMVKKVTGSSELVGYVGALETIPFLLLGPFAGVAADRWDRKTIMLFSDLLSGAFLLGFAVLVAVVGSPPLWSLLLAPFALSCFRCFFNPAKSAAVPSLAPPDQLQAANALSVTSQTFTGLVSLSVSATVLSLLYTLSPLWFYLSAIGLNASSFLISGWFIQRLPSIVPQREGDHPHPMVDLKEGLAYIGKRSDLKVLTVLLTIFRLTVAPFFVFYLAANDAWLGGKPQTLAFMELAFMAGMLATTLVMQSPRPHRPLLWFASGLAFVGVTVSAMGFTRSLAGFVVLNLLAGLALPPGDIAIATYLQLSVPDAFRGRVNAVREMIATGMMPLGMLLGGLLIERVGIKLGFIGMGIGMMAACLVGFLSPSYRSATMPPTEAVVESTKCLSTV